MKSCAVYLFMLTLFLTMRCSRVDSVRPADRISAEDHYKAGLAALEQEDWENAAKAFQRAIKVAPHYANGYAGAALVLAMKNQPDKAVEYAEKAVKLDEKSFDARVVLGRVLAESKPEAWFERAMQAFDAALKMRPLDEEALYFKARALVENRDLEQAKDLYRKVSAQGERFAPQAEDQIIYINNYQLISPRTAVGDTILQLERITRADLAVLLVAEFDIVATMRRQNPNYAGGKSQRFKEEDDKRIRSADVISDIKGHWAEVWIKDAVRAGGMDVYTDSSFRPDELLQRANLAMTLQNIVIQVTGNHSLYTAFIHTPSNYADVKRTHYAYNAIRFVTEYEIMPAPVRSDRFDLDGAVSGFDALLALRNLQGYLNASL
ncbi:tetratricopeptide repeat protein [candidate division KSB1 bacterium]|nr:tetratricopeptide repeat protein [candidate division KSB1 bacterium]RQW08811.1 MAG: tetratricopeptide repeat protein [candidate division KSB1 bacterium]